MLGTVGRVMLTAAALAAGSSGPCVAESLQHGAVDKLWTASSKSWQYSVDFSSLTTERYEIDPGNYLYPGGSQTHAHRKWNKKWTIPELHEEMSTDARRQERMNDRMDAIEKARLLCGELGTAGPPDLADLHMLEVPDDLVTTGALSGVSASARVWDSGATTGMTRPGSTAGQVASGRWA